MSVTKVVSCVGVLAGLGFGIFASVKNFDPDAHQSQDMAESTRIFSELLTQIGMASMQAASLGLLTGLTGFVIDCLTCCKFVTEEELAEKRSLMHGIV